MEIDSLLPSFTKHILKVNISERTHRILQVNFAIQRYSGDFHFHLSLVLFELHNLHYVSNNKGNCLGFTTSSRIII